MLAVFLGDWELGNSGSREEPFLPAYVKEVENSTGKPVLQVACQISVLTLEMTEDALRDASTYERRCASKRALRLSHTANSASSNHHALGGRLRRLKGMEALAALRRSDEKDRAAQ